MSSTKCTGYDTALVNSLRSIPDFDGVPIKYIIRRKEVPNPMIRLEFLKMYVPMHVCANDNTNRQRLYN